VDYGTFFKLGKYLNSDKKNSHEKEEDGNDEANPVDGQVPDEVRAW
jgi:hypothetical protein